MDTLWKDLRFGARTLWKSPGFTLVAVLTLALGIAANTTIFSLVNSVMLRPLPYAEPERLVMLAVGGKETSAADFFDWRAQSASFEQMAAMAYWSANLGGVETPERVQGFLVTPEFFTLLGVQPFAGRAFLPAEAEAGQDGVAIISHGLWRRAFGSDPNLVGKNVPINGRPRTVVGIMPAGFQFYREADAWAPLAFAPADLAAVSARRARYLLAPARLKPGVTLEQAQAELNAVTRRLEEQYPQTNTGRHYRVAPLHEEVVGSIRTPLLVLLGAVGFVLLIACANVANLLLARAAARQREFSVRVALGAGRGRIVRQLLTESVLLALAGGAAGLVLTFWGGDLLMAAIPRHFISGLPAMQAVEIDKAVLGFTLGVSLLTGVVFGLAPALQFSNPDLNRVLKEGGRGAGGGSQSQRLRGLLVIAEVALSLMLLVGAGLLIRSFVGLMGVTPGFDPDRLLTMQITLPQLRYPEPEKAAAFYEDVIRRVESLPGVAGAAATTNLPLGGSDQTTRFTVEGRPAPPRGQEPEVSFRDITPGYFQTMGIPLLRGRAFDERDRTGAPLVAVISETLARQQFGSVEGALGQRLSRPVGADTQTVEVVGVVADVRHTGLKAEPKSELYLSELQDSARGMTLVVRAEGDPAALASAVRGKIQEVDKDQPVFDVRTMREVIATSVNLNRFSMLLLSLFALVALLLAAVGLYGVMSYAVAQRTSEIGIRIALGAQGRDIFRLVVGQSMALALAGMALGVGGSFAVTRVLTSLLYGVSATDPLVFAGVALLLALVALVACYVPARRAMKVDPMVALRYE